MGSLGFFALGQQSFGYLGGSTAHTIRPGLSWLLNLYFLPSREPPAAPLLCPKPQLQLNKHDIKADIGLAPRIWAHILPNFQIKQLLSLKWFQERMAFVAGNNPHILSHILGDRHLKVPLSWPQMYFVDHSFSLWFGLQERPGGPCHSLEKGRPAVSCCDPYRAKDRESKNPFLSHTDIFLSSIGSFCREANKIML